jgi:hypothetical protein
MRRRRAGDQPDLFQMTPSGVQLRMVERAALLPMVRRLLLEVMFNKTAETSSAEGNHE